MLNGAITAFQISRTDNVKWVIVRAVMYRGSPANGALHPDGGSGDEFEYQLLLGMA